MESNLGNTLNNGKLENDKLGNDIVNNTANISELYTQIGNIDNKETLKLAEQIIKNLEITDPQKSKKNSYLIHKLKGMLNLKDGYKKAILTAIKEDKIVVVYQPIVDIRNLKIVGVESLVRLIDEEDKIIMPILFIPFAEENELLDAISNLTIKKTFLQNKEWEDMGYTIKTSINISGVQIDKKLIYKILKKHIEETCVSVKNIMVEITESETFDINNIPELMQMGMAICIDDFGTQYSHLNKIQEIDAKVIKIDRIFVQDIQENKNFEIVNHVVALAHKLGMVVVAEGVETQEQLEYLRETGCDYIQGYLISKPVCSEEITQMLIDQEKN